MCFKYPLRGSLGIGWLQPNFLNQFLSHLRSSTKRFQLMCDKPTGDSMYFSLTIHTVVAMSIPWKERVKCLVSEEQFPQICWNLKNAFYFLEDGRTWPHEYLRECGQSDKDLYSQNDILLEGAKRVTTVDLFIDVDPFIDAEIWYSWLCCSYCWLIWWYFKSMNSFYQVVPKH